MRRELRVLIAATMVSSLGLSSAIAGDSSSLPPREERIPYSVGESSVFGVDSERGVIVSSVRIEIRRERLLDLTVADALGTEVAGAIVGEGGLIANFCGATAKPVTVRPFEVVEVQLLSGTCDSGAASVVTEGEVIATLYKRTP